MLSPVTGPREESKAALRARVLAARRALDPAQLERAASSVTRFVLDLPDVMAARCVAAYLSIGTEPSTAELLTRLRSRGVRLLLPVVLDDLDLDWAIYDEPSQITQDTHGLWNPVGPRLGVDAIAEADVVITPALAVAADTGVRLGRGGGCYDRALARVPAARLVVALLHEGELLPRVPTEPHDRPVDLAVLPSGLHRFRPAGAEGRP